MDAKGKKGQTFFAGEGAEGEGPNSISPSALQPCNPSTSGSG